MIFRAVRGLAALLILTAGCTAEPQPSTAQAAGTLSPAGLELAPLEIRSGNRTHRFTVEVARTFAQQERGLMFRKKVGPSEGMLFPFSPPQTATFWMKNTLIPLDMLFIRADGTIAFVAANTKPMSLDPVTAGEPVVAVLEIAGGRSLQLGIKDGDRASWPGGPTH